MINYYWNLDQGTDEWLQARLGILTASQMKLIITPTLKMASNDKSRSHEFELCAQRITGFAENVFITDDMLRGSQDEIEARDLYSKNFEPVKECGFVTNNKFGFILGYSPDGLVGDEGLIEIKSRRQKYQIETIINGVIPEEYVIQIQTGLLITERKWCDFISYSNGLPMLTIRAFPDVAIQEEIIKASIQFESKVNLMLLNYNGIDFVKNRMVKTERKIFRDGGINL